MVLQIQGACELQVLHPGSVPGIPERQRRHLLPPAGVALVARQGSESPSKAMASIDPLVDAIRTPVDAVVSLRQLTLRHIERFPAAVANYGTAAGIQPFNAQGRLTQTSQIAAT
jgi:hypothetical protein